MGNEQDLFYKRMMDLSRQADRKGIVIYSDFLNLNEQNLLFMVSERLDTSYALDGGHPYAERRVAAFLPEESVYSSRESLEYPLVCLKISPSHPKFADALTHRDVLGSVMSLGMERSKIGDILCRDNHYYLFCKENIKDYLCDTLIQIKHTQVRLEPISAPETVIRPEFTEKSGIISSNRLDNVIACFCGCSRSEASRLITGGKVFVNGRETVQNTYICKEGETFSVRSHGKYIFDGCLGETKKGRTKIKFRIYS